MKTPWLPEKPKTARKCKKCDGSGYCTLWSGYPFYSTPKQTICIKCGGKGFR